LIVSAVVFPPMLAMQKKEHFCTETVERPTD